MAFSTQVITDLKLVQTNGTSAVTAANAINPTGLTATGAAGNMAGTSGIYGSGTFYGGVMDYPGNVGICLLKCQELAVLLAKILVNTDATADAANQALLAKILNVFQ